MKYIKINEKIPEDIHKEIGKYLNNKNLFNLVITSKFNYQFQKEEVKRRYDNLVEKYNPRKMREKYCKSRIKYRLLFLKTKYEKCSVGTILINMFLIIKKKDKQLSETIYDLENIITLIKSGYKEYIRYNDDLRDVIFILIPWSKGSDILFYFFKKMLKNKILDPNITNLSGAYPIQHAIAYSNFEAIKLLVKEGSKIHLKDRFCRTVIDLNTIKDSKIHQYLYNKIFMKRIY